MELKRSHVLYDVWADSPQLLETVPFWQDVLLTAAQTAGTTVLAQQFHQFTPVGVTGFLLLPESHISLHTWPGERLVTIDVFTCGLLDADSIIVQIRRQVQPIREAVTIVERGKP